MLIYNFDAIIPNNTFSYDGIDCQMIKILIQIILDDKSLFVVNNKQTERETKLRDTKQHITDNCLVIFLAKLEIDPLLYIKILENRSTMQQRSDMLWTKHILHILLPLDRNINKNMYIIT